MYPIQNFIISFQFIFNGKIIESQGNAAGRKFYFHNLKPNLKIASTYPLFH